MVITYVKKAELKAQTRLAKRLRSKLKRLKKVKKKKKKLELKKAIQAAIGRRKLLQAILKEKKPVNVLARVEDTIPNVLIKRRDEEIKPTFLKKGGLI